ncbi:hypothetical protein GCM10016234_35530 [Tianweitania populi]|uniref:Glucosamine inositolphosphorylceramide transferase 1 N-terminal domain-containing protein n=1 Tax=Tianweitania populi TaxID=1607949 RepID=A0A8J3GM42_9HYPH|nr:hypothetical protein GCM10016234_35530 [Tianweitania populi]
MINLAPSAPKISKPTLTLTFAGCSSFEDGLAQLVTGSDTLDLVASIDGIALGRARPMIRDRLWLKRASDDLLAGALSLILQTVSRFAANRLVPLEDMPSSPTGQTSFARHYPLFFSKAVVARLIRKVQRRKRPFYWQVAYRSIKGGGVAETGAIDGAPFTVLPDDGTRFYADPFVFEHEGRMFLFVEEFPYALNRGVISVAELQNDGTFDTPRRVLEEPHHLSYPQVFRHDGEIYMLPESAAARELVLYRAASFPDTWVRDRVLLADRDINDATVLQHGGRFWLVATERVGVGGPSDTMVVLSADNPRGPWIDHALNPVAIDHSAARPGGSFIRTGERILLPVQNGSQSYGGGLGLMELQQLDDGHVRFSAPEPIRPGSAWDRKGIHTLNRVGRVEVIDSAG